MLLDWLSYYLNKKQWKSLQTFDEFVGFCGSPARCGQAAIHHFSYRFDGDEHLWQSPKTTWERRGLFNKMLGDCEDWARFFCLCLNKNCDEDAVLMVVSSSKKCHATCVSRNWTIGTYYRIKHPSNKYKDIAEFFVSDWNKIKIYSQETDGNFQLRKILQIER